MKIKFSQILIIVYFLLIFIILKTFNFFSIAFLVVALLVDNFTNIRDGIKYLLYLLAALSVFLPLFYIFMIYFPFIIFGFLLKKRSFVRSYVLGFAISFIPSSVIYLISTYLSIQLNIPIIAFIFYLPPLIAFLIFKKDSIEMFQVDRKEFIFFLTVLFFTSIIAINIVDNSNLFMVNHSREFYRIQNSFQGLDKHGLVPLYDPAIANGEATYLWIPSVPLVHIAITQLFLKFVPPILFINADSVFILLLSTLSLGMLFFSILNKKKSTLNVFAVTAVTLLTGLNFVFLQFMESIRTNYAYPVAYLLLGLILDNPKTYKEFAILMFIGSFIVTLHPAYGFSVVIFAGLLFFLRKFYYFKEKDEMIYFLKWIAKNKLKILVTIVIAISVPLFYISTPIIFKDVLVKVQQRELSLNNVGYDVTSYFKSFYRTELHYLSLKYPDVNRIDDHKFGFFVSIFGALSFFLLIAMYKNKDIKNYRVFALAYILYLIVLSPIAATLSIRIGGLFRFQGPYLLILLGVSILTLICLTKIKYLKVISIAVVFIAFISTVPYASQHITALHRESFMGGDIYKSEMEFLKQVPIDGRIMTYGLFGNVIDYGISYFTGRYGARNEQAAISVEGGIFGKIHGQNSWGTPEIVTSNNGIQLSNYLRLGGYKYLFMNIQHPIGNYVLSQVYPDFTYPLYQNGPLVFLAVNNTHYIEKIDLVKNVSEDTYKKPDGYKYKTISAYSDLEHGDIDFKKIPREPEPLRFERPSNTHVKIFGNFSDGEIVVFKEQYFLRWKAYMDNKEVPVFTGNHELILIRTIEGNNILLEYSPLRMEKIIGIASLTAFLGFLILFLFLLKRTHAENKAHS